MDTEKLAPGARVAYAGRWLGLSGYSYPALLPAVFVRHIDAAFAEIEVDEGKGKRRETVFASCVFLPGVVPPAFVGYVLAMVERPQ